MVDNDLASLEKLRKNLASENYEVKTVSNNHDLAKIKSSFFPAVIIIDPFSVERKILKSIIAAYASNKVIVICYSENEKEKDIIKCLNGFAQDYVLKKQNVEILTLKIRKYFEIIENCYSSHTQDIQRKGNIIINHSEKKISINGSEVNMKKSEFNVFSILFNNPDRILSREEIISLSNGKKYYVSGKTIDNSICSIRKKINSSSAVIETVHGYGYMFKLK